MPGVDVAHPLRVGRDVWGQGRADLAHEGQGRFRRCPDPQHQGTLGGRVAEAVPVPARSHEQRPGHRFGWLVVAVYEQPAAEHVDRLVEIVVRVRDGSGEMRRDGELHGGEAGRQAVLACEEALTPDDQDTIIVNPPTNLPVDPKPLFANGKCWPST